MRNLIVTGTAPGRRHRRAHDVAQQAAVHRERRPAALAGDLAHRAAEVHVDVVDAALVDQEAHRLANVVRVDAVELHDRVASEPSKRSMAQGACVALDQRAGGDHLAHVEPGAEAAAHAAERRVGDPGHRRQHDRRADRERPDAQRVMPRGP